MASLRLPKKLKVGGMVYDVYFPHEFPEARDYLGLHSGVESFIKIGTCRDRASGERDKQSVLDTFLHETMHAIDFNYCGDVMNEDDIELLTRGFYQVMADNDLNLKSDDLPDTLRICGTNFSIVYPYVYKDYQDVSSHLDLERYIIYIGSEMQSMVFCKDFIKMTFIYTLVCCILFMYATDKYCAEFKEKIVLKSLASGIYQVFKDNKIEELFEKWTKQE